MKAYKEIFAITLAVVVFSISHKYLTNYTNSLAQNPSEFVKLQQWLIFSAYSLYFISGALSALISQTKAILVSTITGFICSLFAVLLFNVGGSALGITSLVILGSILGLLGGALIIVATKLFIRPLTSSSSGTDNP